MAEESNTAIADSWEDIQSEDVDQRLQKLHVERNTKDSLPVSSVSAPRILLREEGHRTPYTPAVRILKRESDVQPVQQTSPRTSPQTKSLKQREADYAKARLRILGPSPPQQTKQAKATHVPAEARSIAVASRASPPKPAVTLARQPKCPESGEGFQCRR